MPPYINPHGHAKTSGVCALFSTQKTILPILARQDGFISPAAHCAAMARGQGKSFRLYVRLLHHCFDRLRIRRRGHTVVRHEIGEEFEVALRSGDG